MNNFLVSNVDDDTEIRLDHYLSDKKNMTRSSVQSIIKSGLVLVNEKKIIKPSFSIKNGNTIKIINSVKSESKFSKLNIIYEDDFIFILEKPADLLFKPITSIFFPVLFINSYAKFVATPSL